MLVEPVIARLQDRVPDLRSVGGALDLAAMVKANALAQQGNAAHVVPAVLRGGAVRDMAPGFVQERIEQVAVILSFRHIDAARGDTTGVAAMIEAVLDALCGWEPDGYPNCFQLVSGAPVTMPSASFAYALTFALPHHIRTFA